MKWRSRLLLALAALIHPGLPAGWRWQMPLVPSRCHSFETNGKYFRKSPLRGLRCAIAVGFEPMAERKF